ncbi:MAG: hypothetical protein QOI56_1812 [Actinomycetota bacterium]|nr:hypothetical protein [Actinomycetota bacterium]
MRRRRPPPHLLRRSGGVPIVRLSKPRRRHCGGEQGRHGQENRFAVQAHAPGPPVPARTGRVAPSRVAHRAEVRRRPGRVHPPRKPSWVPRASDCSRGIGRVVLLRAQRVRVGMEPPTGRPATRLLPPSVCPGVSRLCLRARHQRGGASPAPFRLQCRRSGRRPLAGAELDPIVRLLLCDQRRFLVSRLRGVLLRPLPCSRRATRPPHPASSQTAPDRPLSLRRPPPGRGPHQSGERRDRGLAHLHLSCNPPGRVRHRHAGGAGGAGRPAPSDPICLECDRRRGGVRRRRLRARLPDVGGGDDRPVRPSHLGDRRPRSGRATVISLP